MAVAIGSQLGSYEITALLGKGGMGEVYRARDTKLKRDVAIKILPAEFSRDNERTSRFQREAEVLASLNHPNIAAIYDLQQANDIRLLVLELVEGETLADRILRGPIPIDEALEIGRHICEALEAAYEKGIVHRDLKPANVKVTPDGRVKVLDFGLAKAMSGANASATARGNQRMQNTTASATLSNSPTLTIGATQAGMILGTAAYMSPEQAGGKNADHRSDVWSFGTVLYEMLTAKQAFPGESVSDILASVLKVEPDWDALPSSTPESIRNVIQRCVTKNVKQRLQAIGEARIAIERQIANPQSGALLAERVARRSSKLPWILAVAAMAAAVAVSVVHFREPVRTQHVARFTVPSLPDNVTMHSFAVSPDGHYVVMAPGEVNGKRQLWLRALDALEAQPIPLTDDAVFPFWSPDSRYIAFFAQGRLKKIAVSGGPPQVLCSVDDGRGGSWNRDDVIIFASRAGQIQKVLASGGVPANITQSKIFAPAPMFLPDGRSFLYSVTRPNRGGIYVSPLEGGDARLILEDATNALFAPSTVGSRQGHLLYLRESTLMARPFDSTNAKFTGEEFPVAEDVSTNPRGPYTAMAVSENGVLIYWNNASISSNEIVWFDRAGKPLGSMAGLHGGFPSISPDDKTIAFARGAAGRSIDVWLWDLARGTDTRLTSDLSRNVDPVWSPKGNRIVFRSERGESTGDLYHRAANGSGQDELLVKTPNNKIVSQWSRNGFVVYSEISQRNSWDISVVPVAEDGKASGQPMAFLHTEFSETQGQISPDGRWMAYVSNESGQRQVYVRPFPAGDDKSKISIAGGVQPRWRRDSQELFFVTSEGKFMAVPVKAIAGSKLSFGSPTPLFETHLDTAGLAMKYDVAADGTKFFVETEAASSPPRLTVWVNWLAGLKR